VRRSTLDHQAAGLSAGVLTLWDCTVRNCAIRFGMIRGFIAGGLKIHILFEDELDRENVDVIISVDFPIQASYRFFCLSVCGLI
jgi:hypothetical protein